MFKNHPRGLSILFLTEMWERFSYYGMRALLIFYLTKHFLMSDKDSFLLFASYASLVYAMPIIGGLLADRYLGARKAVTIGALFLCLGHLTMAFEGEAAFHNGTEVIRDQFALNTLYLALALIIVGVGFLKANISAMVGKLYSQNDTRRDSGFTLFYMGINLGSAVAIWICGYIGEEYGWGYGFGLAGIGMLVGLATFLMGQKHLLNYAEPPDPEKLKRPVLLKLSPEHWIWLGAIGAVLVVWYVIQFNFIINGFMLIVAAVSVTWFIVFSLAKCDRQERNNMLIMLILIASSVLFWALFEQAGTSLSLFTDRVVDRTIFGFEIKASQFQSLNPIFIVLLAPLFAIMWHQAAERHLDPSIPAKFSLGIIQVGLGFLALVIGAQFVDESGKVAMIWLVIIYFFHTTGELCLSPIGLSMVTKLSLKRVVGVVMGMWFLSSAFAANVGGLIASTTSIDTEGGAAVFGMAALNQYIDVFTILAIIAIVFGFILLAVSPLLNRYINATYERDSAAAATDVAEKLEKAENASSK